MARPLREPIPLHPTGPDAACAELYRELGIIGRIIADLKLEVARLQAESAQPRRERGHWSPKDLAADLGISRHQVYALVERGELEALRMGKKIAIPAASYTRYLARLHGED